MLLEKSGQETIDYYWQFSSISINFTLFWPTHVVIVNNIYRML